jgi:hypothetical protein
MRRLILGLSAFVLLAAAVAPARACINDREVKRSEREFKSQYQQPAPAGEPSYQPPAPQSPGLSVAFLGGGAVLLLGAAGMVLGPRKPPSRR